MIKGTSEIVRFQCACHKMNIAVRTSIANHQPFLELIRSLNNQIASIKKSIRLSHNFTLLKCRLRLENATRWSSTYMMLESIKKAFDRNAFKDVTLPIKEIEIYLQILKPAYILSLNWQKETCTISDLLIGLTKYLYDLERLNIDGEASKFAFILIECIKSKFEYELNSQIYKVQYLFINHVK
jgi:hypothetical protein